jgi:hypothetical protein
VHRSLRQPSQVHTGAILTGVGDQEVKSVASKR